MTRRVPVLMYHRLGIPDNHSDIYCIHPGRFAGQMHALAAAGYQAVGIDAFQQWQAGRQDLPANAFLLTFDDGFMGVHDHALPVLASLGWPATVFLVAGKIGQQSDWQVTTRYPMAPHPLMGRDQLLRIQAAGISLQSHSLEHHDLTTLDMAMLTGDLAGSRERIAEIAGAMPDYLAYPYGRYNDSVCQAAAAAGFTMAFTVDSGFNSPGQDRYRIRRIDVFGSDSPAMLKRKVRLGTNDGSLGNLAGYYMRRVLRRV